jgi:hypothetical protein
MKAWNHVHSLGLGGFLCGGLLGLLFLIYPGVLPPHATTHDVLLVGSFLGAGCQRLLARIFGPVHFYSRLLQLTLLRPIIGERTQSEIMRELTLRYFLGERRASIEVEQTRTLPLELEQKE